MPLVIHPRVKRNVRRAAALTSIVCLGGAGAAHAACPIVPTSQPFAQFGDYRNYVLTPGGGFETGMVSWTGGTGVLGNESFFARSTADSRSRQIAANGVTTSPRFCVDATYPTLRVFAKKTSGTVGQLKVDVLYTDANGYARVAKAGVLSNSGQFNNWRPSGSLSLASALPTTSTTSLQVQLRFTADRDGSWAIDDVFADPYRSR